MNIMDPVDVVHRFFFLDRNKWRSIYWHTEKEIRLIEIDVARCTVLNSIFI